MLRTTRPRRTTRLILLLVVLGLAGAACTPAAGPLGTPSTPAPSGDASVAIPTGDETPGPSEAATATPAPSETGPSASSSASAAPSASSSTSSAPFAAPSAAATPAPNGTTIVRAYFVLGSFTGNSGLVPVLREIPATTGVASAAIRQLIAGPNAGELAARPAMYTTVPSSTRLLGLSIHNGVATVSLSSEFRTSSDRNAPLAQVVYTLTQFSTVQRVVIQIEGSHVAAPATRDGYAAFLPAIFVDRPAWGAAAGNPAKVSGVANVFEATFRVQLKDASGKVIADRQVMASCGTGCWGDFSTTVAYTVSKAQWGTLRVFDLSAKDGSPEHVTEYPVWLTPAG